MSAIQVGDLLRRTDGGPVLEVEAISPNGVTCFSWSMGERRGNYWIGARYLRDGLYQRMGRRTEAAKSREKE